MKTAAGPETLIVNGMPLRQAREGRGLSIAEMAAVVTLSREQVKALEDGGNLPFYTAAHKLLALRKLASALAIPLDDVIAAETVADAPTSGLQGSHATRGVHPITAAPQTTAHTADHGSLRLQAVERTARLRMQLALAAVAGALLLAVYAKWRGTTEVSTLPATELTEAAATTADPAAPVTPPASAALDPSTTPQLASATAETAATPPSPAARTEAVVPGTAAAAETRGTPDCGLQPGTEPARWSPPYQRKPDTRLFFVSRSAAEVCVTDASGKTQRLQLAPSVGQAFVGQPPYTVHSERLPAMDIYLQGMRARIGADTRVLQLVPTRTPPPVAADDAGN